MTLMLFKSWHWLKCVVNYAIMLFILFEALFLSYIKRVCRFETLACEGEGLFMMFDFEVRWWERNKNSSLYWLDCIILTIQTVSLWHVTGSTASRQIFKPSIGIAVNVCAKLARDLQGLLRQRTEALFVFQSLRCTLWGPLHRGRLLRKVAYINFFWNYIIIDELPPSSSPECANFTGLYTSRTSTMRTIR